MNIKNFSLKTLIFFIITSFSNGYGLLLEGNYSYFGIPLILFSNPCRISDQPGIPFGVQYENFSGDNWVLRSGIVVPFTNNGFSAAHEFVSEERMHSFLSGFNHIQKNFSVATLFRLRFDSLSNTSLFLDAGFSHRFNDFLISLLLKDFKISHSDAYCTPSLNLLFSGPVSYFKNSVSYDLALFLQLREFSGVYFPGSSLTFRYSSNRFPSLLISAGYDAVQNRERNFESTLHFSLGINFKANSIVSGAQSGFGRNISTGDDIYRGSFYFNINEFMDRVPPEVKLSFENHPESGIYFGLHARDDQRGSGLKSWALLISESPSLQAGVIRVFSGGSVAPSVIHWDGRDLQGNLIDDKSVYARLVAVDNANNTTHTDWIEIR